MLTTTTVSPHRCYKSNLFYASIHFYPDLTGYSKQVAEEQIGSGRGEKKNKKSRTDECEWVVSGGGGLLACCPVDAATTTHGIVKRDDDATTALSSSSLRTLSGATAPHSMPSSPTAATFLPASLACEEKAVASFLASICCALLPVKLFGDRHNLTIVINTVRRLVRLKRGECLELNRLPQGMRVNAVEWLLTKSELGEEESGRGHKSGVTNRKWKIRRTCISSTRARERALLCLLRWIVCRLCVSILRANFYATDGEGFGHQILFFRGPVWIYLRRQELRKLVRGPFAWDDHIEERNNNNDMEQDDSCTRYQRVDDDLISSKTASPPPCSHLRVQNMVPPPTAHLPPSVLRLLPKKFGGFRGLVTLSRGVNYGGKIGQRAKGGGANAKLRDLFHILKYELSVQPQKIGFGVLGMDDIFARLKPYFCSWRESNSNINSPSSLFIVSCDIAGCYDSIQLDRLIGIAEESMSQDSYVIQRLSCCTPHEALRRCFTRWPCTARPADYPEPLRQRASHIASRSYSAIISETPRKSSHFDSSSSSLPIDRQFASKLLRQHLLNHRVIVPGEHTTGSQSGLMLQQIRGIPQGSVLSTFLCHMYYGQFENEVLRRVFDEADKENDDSGEHRSSSTHHHLSSSSRFSSDSLLIRLVDDFLLVTPRRRVAISFLNAMSDSQKTSPSYGFTVKMEKTCVSFHMSEEEVKLTGGTFRQFPKTAFPWCGLLLDGQQGEVAFDLSRLLSIPLRYSFSVQHGGISPGVTLCQKMKSFLGARMHLLLIDTELNSQRRVLVNTYGLLLLCAGKTLAYAQQQKWRGGGGGGRCSAQVWDSRENTLVRMIIELAFYAHSLMRSRAGGRLKGGFSRVQQQDIGLTQELKGEAAAATTRCCSVVTRCNVKRCDVVWLALAAFDAVLSSPYQKQGHQWDGLKRKLKRAMGCSSMRMGGPQIADNREHHLFLKNIVNDPSARSVADEFELG